jgi:7-cyano-7-deazaguanine synthase in queuosine biosynthesis
MGKLALVTKVGATDQGLSFPDGAYQSAASVSILHNMDRNDISIEAFTTALKKLKLEPTERMMDLLVIAASMYSADTRISRAVFAEDTWTRMIDLYIPVSDPDFWNGQVSLLQKIFRFLTGDIWKVTFRERSDSNLTLSPRGRHSRYGMPYETDTVCLFSGGMDSFIGAVDLLEAGTRPLLVGHAKSNDVSRYQRICGEALDSHYGDQAPERVYAFVRIPKEDLFGLTENTERGRSFLFLTLGAISASSLSNSSKLVVPENGMISLNIPLTPLRVGSHSTRTTHPHYFSMMQSLFDNMESGVNIVNPYQFKTKGEMLKECLSQQLVVDTETMSCSHPFVWRSTINAHCGYCVPCIIRQAAFHAAGLQDKFVYRNDIFDGQGLDIRKTKGADALAFKYMIEKVRKNPGYLYATIRNTGSLGNDVTDFVEIYKRALHEVDSLINRVKLV